MDRPVRVDAQGLHVSGLTGVDILMPQVLHRVSQVPLHMYSSTRLKSNYPDGCFTSSCLGPLYLLHDAVRMTICLRSGPPDRIGPYWIGPVLDRIGQSHHFLDHQCLLACYAYLSSDSSIDGSAVLLLGSAVLMRIPVLIQTIYIQSQLCAL